MYRRKGQCFRIIINELILTVTCLVLPLVQFRLYYALYIYSLPKAVALADKLLVVLIVTDRTIELNDLEITRYICIFLFSRRFAACKGSLNGVEIVISAKLRDNILAHSSHLHHWDPSRRGGRGGTWW